MRPLLVSGPGRGDAGARTAPPGSARERLRSPQRVRPLLPVRLPLRIPALASDLREGLLNTIRLPESNEPGETLLRCRRCSLLWWVSASRDSTREYVVKTLVEAYFFGLSSFPAPGDLANTHVCAGRWSGACVPGRFAGVRGSCLVAWAWPLVETFLSTRETWNFIFTWHFEIVLELSDWNVCFWCSLFPLLALLQITMAFCGVGSFQREVRLDLITQALTEEFLIKTHRTCFSAESGNISTIRNSRF